MEGGGQPPERFIIRYERISRGDAVFVVGVDAFNIKKKKTINKNNPFVVGIRYGIYTFGWMIKRV